MTGKRKTRRRTIIISGEYLRVGARLAGLGTLLVHYRAGVGRTWAFIIQEFKNDVSYNREF